MAAHAWRRLDTPWARYGALVLLTVVLAYGAVALSAGGQSTSAWWPATGTAVLAVLAVPRRHWVTAAVGIVVIGVAANLVAGRAWDLSLLLGVGNGLEALLVVQVLLWKRERARLDTVWNVTWLLGAALAGAAAAAIIAGIAVATVADGEFGATARSVLASHVSAVLAIVPLALVQGDDGRRRGGALRWLQPAVLVACLAVLLPSTDQFPIVFVFLPVLLWGAFVLSTRMLYIETLVTAATVTVLTLAGIGPFATQEWIELDRRFVVQGFLLALVGSALYVSAARLEQLATEDRVRRREELLRAAIVGAPFGMLLLRVAADGAVRVVQSNTRAVAKLGQRVATGDRPGGAGLPLRPVDGPTQAVLEAVRRSSEAAAGETTHVEAVVRGRTLELAIARTAHADEDELITIHIEDVTEERERQLALEQTLRDEQDAAAHLRAVDREREAFVASVSHELRTPITSILGFAEIMQDEVELDEGGRGYLGIIERNAQRLRDLVEDILAMTASTTTSADRCDAAQVVAHIVEDMRPAAASREVELRLDDAPPTPVEGVLTDIERIVTNLLGNAVKFSPPGAAVDVRIEHDDGVAQVLIVDAGPGIPSDQLEAVFGRFQRGEFATANQVPGVGLGLSMVREMAERNGFTVRLESDGASGTTAVIEIPLAHAEGDD